MSPGADIGADDTPWKQEYIHHTFASPKSYFQGLLELPKRLYWRVLSIVTPEQELHAVKSRSNYSLKATLEWYDMIMFGIGAMVGAGIFVATGSIANGIAGPAVIISYIVSGISAMLSALLYSEFAIQVPTAGGAFTYLRITMGEYLAFLTAGNLIMEYVLSASAVARGFTSYMATIFGNTNTDAWRIYVPSLADGFQYLDPIAVGLIIVLTVLLCWGIKESSWGNIVTTIVHLLLMFFIIICSFIKGNVNNLTQPDGFFPYGQPGVFTGAAVAYFSYIGFDAVATMAEECRKPEQAIPIGIVGSVAFTVVLYCLMALAISLLQPYNEIDPDAGFSVAFIAVGWQWAGTIVGIGAVLGTITSTMMSLLGQARYIVMIARAHMIPLVFARINGWTQTPVIATIVLSSVSAIVALFTSLDILIGLVSVATLFVFFMVGEALMIRRYYVKSQNKPWLILGFLALFTATSIGFSTFYWVTVGTQWWGLVLCGGAAIIEAVAFYFLVPPVFTPTTWHVPFSPFIPLFSIFLQTFLLASLSSDQTAFPYFGYLTAGLTFIYLVYSVHSTWDIEGMGFDNDPFFTQKKTIDEESLKPVDAPLAEGTATESLVPPPEVVDPVKP